MFKLQQIVLMMFLNSLSTTKFIKCSQAISVRWLELDTYHSDSRSNFVDD